MPSVRKSVLVPFGCDLMFDLVDGVEHYPEFLPWCSGTQVLERSAGVTRARIEIDYHGLASAFTTRNEKCRPHSIGLELVDGPFDALRGGWRFARLGDAGCRVELALDYALASAALEALLGPVIGHIMETLVDRFVARAEALAG
jgi:ribosome-associated toxin RatA of RatAB toxin-antitoxin module